MKAAIDAVPYASAVKFGLQFSRRFWEEDEHIFGGITYTDLPIRQISYPSAGLNAGGKGVLLGGYTFDGPNSYEFTAMEPAERVRRAVEFGAQIHPQYLTEFENGVSVAWSRVPFTLGLRRRLVGRSAKRALQRPLPDRWPDRVGWRTCLLHPGVAGGRHPVRSRRHPASPQADHRVVTDHESAHDRARAAIGMQCGNASSASPGRSSLRGRSPRLPWPMSFRRRLHAMSRGWEFAERGGADLFNNVCAACHQANAKGAIGAAAYPPLAADTKLASTDFLLARAPGRTAGNAAGRKHDERRAGRRRRQLRAHSFRQQLRRRRFGRGGFDGETEGETGAVASSYRPN